MSKKLFTLLQVLLVLGTVGRAYAENITLDVYEYGSLKGTMTIPASQYHSVMDRMKGTGVTLKRQNGPQDIADREARRQAAERKMDEWRRQNEARRAAALAQQERWKQQFEARHQAALQKEEEFRRQAEQRRIAAQAQQEAWKRQFEERHNAAVQREAEFRRQAEQRTIAAQAQQEAWKTQLDQRRQAAQVQPVQARGGGLVGGLNRVTAQMQ